ncbi:hypothetical protein EDD16DRAFT_948360 [Pisolithus croceorrhizus]|nr:hypothetical protein EDD16DRAFT_948360 [Pisolithus croceorrhizus]
MGLFDRFRGSKKTTTVLPTDIVVFIVCRGQKPGITEVHAERCRFDGMQNDIVIVDTPSFCANIEPDGEEVVREWIDSNYTKRCKLAGMLYMHNLAFDPDDANLRMSNHLSAFRRACRRNLVPSIIHVVPTLSYGARLSDERLRTLSALLKRQADVERARLHNASDGKPFDGKPEAAWDIVQGLLSRSHFDREGSAGSSVTVPSSWSSSSSSRGSEKAISCRKRLCNLCYRPNRSRQDPVY